MPQPTPSRSGFEIPTRNGKSPGLSGSSEIGGKDCLGYASRQVIINKEWEGVKQCGGVPRALGKKNERIDRLPSGREHEFQSVLRLFVDVG